MYFLSYYLMPEVKHKMSPLVGIVSTSRFNDARSKKNVAKSVEQSSYFEQEIDIPLK